MKKFLQEVFAYFWIPLIMALVSYIFFQMRDVLLGIITLVALSAIYTIVRLYFLHKKWWMLVILTVVAFASVGFFLLRAPAITLSINGQKVTGNSITFSTGSVSVSPAPQSVGEYTRNTQVTLTATPAPGYDWKSWAGSENDASNPTIITMSRDKQITVNFEPRFSLIINNQSVIGSFVSFSKGSVTIDPPPGGDGKYSSGTIVTLTARSDSGYDWTGWLGTNKDTFNPATVTISGSNKNVTVAFEPRFSLTVSNQLLIGSVINFTEGSVSVNPPPEDDGKYAYGTKVSLTASPNLGYGWKNWAGTGNDASNPATVTITNDKQVTVLFELRFLLAINNQAVTGSSANFTEGSVSLNPTPGTDARFAKDTAVTLTASPASGYRFDHWEGAASGNITAVTITIDSNKNVTAAFKKIFTLTTSVNPAGSGSVSPASGTFDDGTAVTLTAIAISGYRFDHWEGAASGNVSAVTMTMNSNKNVTAVFKNVFTLTTSVNPAGGGSISPASGTFDDGTAVTLTAIAASGFRFDHWEGAASGNVSAVTITMNSNKSVTAVFKKT
ncbi:MAG: hypothetical protein HY529_04465 [Chloroflexi bacterium]|nr:hypothetical protein [Chloroflexota bacterium]